MTASKKQKHKDRPAIRIGAGSGAANALKAAKNGHTDTSVHDLADEDGGDGLPNKRAYMLLKHIYEEVGDPFHGEGLSWYDKVHAVKIDNASNLLYTTTWREFFRKSKSGKKRKDTDTKNGIDTQKPPPAPIPKKDLIELNPHSYIETKKGDTGNPREKTILERDIDNQMKMAFQHMVQRINLMWMELKMDEKERQFYSQSLCRGPCRHLSQCHALAKYLVVLQDYRLATIDVLDAIDGRENALRRLYGTIATLEKQRVARMDDLGESPSREKIGLGQVHTPIRGGVRSLRGHKSSQHGRRPGPLSLDSGGEPNPKREQVGVRSPFSPHREEQLNNILREDLTVALKDLQLFSVDVVRAVQRWRSCLWRPLPFRWQGLDYLAKMREDTMLLEAGGSRAWLGDFINTIPLCREDLEGVFYYPLAGEQGAGEDYYIILSEAQLGDSDRLSPLRMWFNEDRDRQQEEELSAAVAVVLEHPHLLAALERERRHLEHEGVFIPVLKVTFDPPRGSKTEQEKDQSEIVKTLAVDPGASPKVDGGNGEEAEQLFSKNRKNKDISDGESVMESRGEPKEVKRALRQGRKGGSDDDDDDDDDAFMSSHNYNGHEELHNDVGTKRDVVDGGASMSAREKREGSIHDLIDTNACQYEEKEVKEEEEEAMSPPRDFMMHSTHHQQTLHSQKETVLHSSKEEKKAQGNEKEEDENYENDAFEA